MTSKPYLYRGYFVSNFGDCAIIGGFTIRFVAATCFCFFHNSDFSHLLLAREVCIAMTSLPNLLVVLDLTFDCSF